MAVFQEIFELGERFAARDHVLYPRRVILLRTCSGSMLLDLGGQLLAALRHGRGTFCLFYHARYPDASIPVPLILSMLKKGRE